MQSAKSAYSLSTNLAIQYTERVYKSKEPVLPINTETSQQIKSAQIGTSSRKCHTNTSRTIENQTGSKIPFQIQFLQTKFVQQGFIKYLNLDQNYLIIQSIQIGDSINLIIKLNNNYFYGSTIQQIYIEESFMTNNHDKIVQEAQLVAPTVINHLNINFMKLKN